MKQKQYRRRAIGVDVREYTGLDYHETVFTEGGARELMNGEWVISIPGNEFDEVLSPEDFKAQYQEVMPGKKK